MYPDNITLLNEKLSLRLSAHSNVTSAQWSQGSNPDLCAAEARARIQCATPPPPVQFLSVHCLFVPQGYLSLR